jgi:hypothetical protein
MDRIHPTGNIPTVFRFNQKQDINKGGNAGLAAKERQDER